MNLTPRQLEIARLVAVEGKSAKAISRIIDRHIDVQEQRTLSPKTIHVYIQRIADKLPGEGSARLKIMRWWYMKEAA